MYLLHIAQMEMEAFLLISSTFHAIHHTTPYQPTTFFDARSHARQHAHIWIDGYRLRKFFDIFTMPHGSEWLQWLCVCVCMHFLWRYFALASPPCNFDGIRSICSWSLLQFLFFSLCCACFVLSLELLILFLFVLGATQLKDISASILRYELFTLLR